MGRSSAKEEQARLAGMQYALRIAKEKGIEGLEKDLYIRCKHKVPLGVTQDDLDLFTYKVKDQMYDTMKLVATMVLHDKFGYGAQRLDRFWKEFGELCEATCKDYLTFSDMSDILKEEIKRSVEIRKNNENVMVNID